MLRLMMMMMITYLSTCLRKLIKEVSASDKAHASRPALWL